MIHTSYTPGPTVYLRENEKTETGRSKCRGIKLKLQHEYGHGMAVAMARSGRAQEYGVNSEGATVNG